MPVKGVGDGNKADVSNIGEIASSDKGVRETLEEINMTLSKILIILIEISGIEPEDK